MPSCRGIAGLSGAAPAVESLRSFFSVRYGTRFKPLQPPYGWLRERPGHRGSISILGVIYLAAFPRKCRRAGGKGGAEPASPAPARRDARGGDARQPHAPALAAPGMRCNSSFLPAQHLSVVFLVCGPCFRWAQMYIPNPSSCSEGRSRRGDRQPLSILVATESHQPLATLVQRKLIGG